MRRSHGTASVVVITIPRRTYICRPIVPSSYTNLLMSKSTESSSPEPQAAASASPPTESLFNTLTSTAPPEGANANKNPFINAADHDASPSSQGSGSSPSSSSSPPPVNASTRPLGATQDAQAAGDPRVAGLRAMFPDYDEAILLAILESANGREEGAIEILLGMSDPNYKPEAAPAAPALTQEDLDEQLARRLMIEEQDHQQARWYEQQNQRPRLQQPGSRPQDPYYTGPTSGGPQDGPGGKDTMSEIQESLTKAAEVGKKTLGGLFTKVKAKIQEFEQGRSTTGGPQQPQWAGGYDPQQHAGANYAPYQPNQYHGSAAPGGTAGGTSPPQASYYDPSAPSPVISEQAISPPSRIAAPAVQGYDVSPNDSALRASSPPAGVSSTSTSTVPPPASGATPIDGGKLGLLPKRPVSLVRDSAADGKQPRRSESLDDDGLEYAENPFEDQKK
ncbi:hypothetical protein D9611_000383 [Ephemerocybe angulata]|uniref:CUE domain-containing protein n=1 Tax=Ephemerocybe angulata TaxID=980116 RepID=A0A8H5BPL7_9AGAR|nr:hypothetical protein D9611_000383 [Tulosesus angulatus]